MTTPNDIREWIGMVKDTNEYSHMMVLCDTFNYEDFPSYISKHDNAHEVVNLYGNKEFIRVMEVYNLNMDIESQIRESRAYNL